MKRGPVFRWSATPHSKRTGSQRSPILWVPLSQNYQIWRGNTYTEGGLVLGVSHAAAEGGGVPALSNFRGPLLFMRKPFVAELPNVAW